MFFIKFIIKLPYINYTIISHRFQYSNIKIYGRYAYDFCKKWVDKIVTVSDDEVCAAILLLLEKHKLIAEGAGAVSVAAAMFGHIPLEGKKAVCVVSGGNIDVTSLNRIINRGLQMNGRQFTVALEIKDRPGELVNIATLIAKSGANITAISHERTNSDINVNSCVLRITMETRDINHIEEIKEALINNKFNIIKEK